jgi:hypothetical protein
MNEFENVTRIMESAEEYQQRWAVAGPVPAAIILPETLATLMDQVDEAGSRVSAHEFHQLKALLVDAAFGPDSGVESDLLPTLQVMKAMAESLVSYVLIAKHGQGLGWHNACDCARVAVNAFAAGNFTQIGSAI